MAVDRAYMGIATSAMNTTLRDAALFGKLILDRGAMDGRKLITCKWIEEILNITAAEVLY